MMSNAQCRAGRAMADISRETLARLSGVDASAIEAFERRLHTPDEAIIRKLQQALEDAGVVFIPENGGGAGVRLKFTASETKRIATLEGEGGIVGMDDVP